MDHKLLTAASAFTLLLTACAPQLYQPSETQVQWLQTNRNATVTTTELEQGKTLYADNCQQCHELHLPERYTLAEWNSIFPNMAPKTSLDEAGKKKVLYYLEAGAADVVTGGK